MSRKRILFFVHDGSGLGHLRRICRIAGVLQQDFATLIVTGHRDALWMVPEQCEFIHIPNWNRIIRQFSEPLNKEPWYDMSIEEAVRLKSNFFLHVVKAFEPDAIFADYLPLGKKNELHEGLLLSKAKKYLINRGIVDKSDRKFLMEDMADVYKEVYDRIFITADKRILEMSDMDIYNPAMREKVSVVGYVMPEKVDRAGQRLMRGVKEGSLWVVCSGGGGKNAEVFLEYCVKLACSMPDIFFDIVFGPKSKKILFEDSVADNIRISQQRSDLGALNASSDIAIINGGYNSTMEALSGGARIIVYPNQTQDDDEQVNHAKALSGFYPVTLLESSDDLHRAISDELELVRKEKRPSFALNIKGIESISAIVRSDLGI